MQNQTAFSLLSKLLLVIVILQLAMLNTFGTPQIKSVSAFVPCVKTSHVQSAANQSCENHYTVFLDLAKESTSFFNAQKKLFFFLIEISPYATPIYSIYKPPKA